MPILFTFYKNLGKLCPSYHVKILAKIQTFFSIETLSVGSKAWDAFKILVIQKEVLFGHKHIQFFWKATRLYGDITENPSQNSHLQKPWDEIARSHYWSHFFQLQNSALDVSASLAWMK